MDISGISGATASPRPQYRRRADDNRNSRATPQATTSPVLLDPLRSSPPVTYSRIRHSSGFIAQLIACHHDFPQMRERRRASLDETLAVYAPGRGSVVIAPRLSLTA